ncbi:hypothetical protein R3P38DRAFT_3177149 [Favolaschia claudopus]|uniref:DUF6532 domain-containing protein n=1 Tax=Favolaschia claudopus TaxID=2862362 RepID=A0AAW0D2N9_9AGAR
MPPKINNAITMDNSKLLTFEGSDGGSSYASGSSRVSKKKRNARNTNPNPPTRGRHQRGHTDEEKNLIQLAIKIYRPYLLAENPYSIKTLNDSAADGCLVEARGVNVQHPLIRPTMIDAVTVSENNVRAGVKKTARSNLVNHFGLYPPPRTDGNGITIPYTKEEVTTYCRAQVAYFLAEGEHRYMHSTDRQYTPEDPPAPHEQFVNRHLKFVTRRHFYGYLEEQSAFPRAGSIASESRAHFNGRVPLQSIAFAGVMIRHALREYANGGPENIELNRVDEAETYHMLFAALQDFMKTDYRDAYSQKLRDWASPLAVTVPPIGSFPALATGSQLVPAPPHGIHVVPAPAPGLQLAPAPGPNILAPASAPGIQSAPAPGPGNQQDLPPHAALNTGVVEPGFGVPPASAQWDASGFGGGVGG